MIEVSDSPLRWPLTDSVFFACAESDCPRVWETCGLATELEGVGDAHCLGERWDSGVQIGVAPIEDATVEMERPVVEADPGVYGEKRPNGECSFIRADLGGTSGGVLSERCLNRCEMNCG
jgi:hypothetical protein